MTLPEDLFSRANARCHHRAYEQWHRIQRKQQILRSQVGFTAPASARPWPCRRCANYHGLAYGTSRDRRQTLICAIHPYGWQQESPCPDWQAEPQPDRSVF